MWQLGLGEKLQVEQHIKGFPDTTIEFSPLRRETNVTSIQLDLSPIVPTRPFVRVRKVIPKGNRRTKPSVLDSRIRLKAGESLNRVEAEKSRQSLARLGVFDSVRLGYERVDDSTRHLIYEVEEGKPICRSGLAGFGSY